MRRHVSIPRLATVVAWALLSPASRWNELFPAAMVPDYGPLPVNFGSDWNPWTWGRESSTAGKGHIQSRAALSQAEGQGNDTTSLGESLGADATAQALTKRQAAVDSFYAVRQTSAEYQAWQRTPRLSAEALALIGKAQAPQRLADHHFEAASGAIRWAGALARGEFDTLRQPIDDLWTVREESQPQLEEAVARLQQGLQNRAGDLSPPEYLAARKFLTSLAFEVRHVPETPGIAMR
jgi:hypothetical protein